MISNVRDLIARTLSSTKRHTVFTLLFAVVMLLQSCNSSIHEKQADVYDEYVKKIESVSEYDSLKKLNDRLNNELARVLKENSKQLIKEGNKGSKDEIVKLNAAEKAYVKAYISKIAPLIIKKQNKIYDDAIVALTKCTSVSELTNLNGKTYEEQKKLSRNNSWELKTMNKEEKYQKEASALELKKIHFDTLYIKYSAPYIVEETEHYTGMVETADDYEQLKEIADMLNRQRIMFCSEKDSLLARMIAGDKNLLNAAGGICHKEAVAIIEAGERFDSVYMNKFIPLYLETEKNMYEGVVKIIETTNDKEGLNDIGKYTPDALAYFFSRNDREKKWLDEKVKTDSTVFSEQRKARDNAMELMNDLYNKKMNNLGK